MLLKRTAAIGSISVWLCCQLALGQQAPAGFTINVLQGNGAVNFVNQKPVQVPVVRVQDSSGRALAGARVSFQAPDSGPGGTFKGARIYAAVTGPDGTARAAGFTPNGEPGQYMVNVVAEYDGQTAQGQVTQTNVAPPAAQPRHHRLALKIAIGCAAVAGFSYIMYSQFIAKNKPYGQR